MENEPQTIVGIDCAGPGKDNTAIVLAARDPETGIVTIKNPGVNSEEIAQAVRDELLKEQPAGRQSRLPENWRTYRLKHKDGVEINLEDAPDCFDPGCDCGRCESCCWLRSQKEQADFAAEQAAAAKVTADELGLTDSKVRHLVRLDNTRKRKFVRRANHNRMAKASRKRNRVGR